MSERKVENLDDFCRRMQGHYIEQQKCIDQLSRSEEIAWGLIANAFGGNWELASEEWRRAAERWRDEYHDQHGVEEGDD